MTLPNRVEPFRALLYNTERAGDLRDLIAPPYDLIDATRQQELHKRSPYNVVRLELGREADRYGASAATLAKWRNDGILRLAPRPAIPGSSGRSKSTSRPALTSSPRSRTVTR